MSKKITGADLLNGFNSSREDEKDKDKKITGADLLDGANKIYQYRNTNTDSVNDEYINTFISDVNSFFKGTEDTYKGIGWGNASSVYDSTNSTWQGLKTRQDTIRAWLYKNKSRLTEDSYKSLSETLDSIDSGASSILSGFEGMKNFYGQFETEDSYNKWKANEDWKKEFMGQEDFKEYSQKGANIENPSYREAEGWFSVGNWRPFGKVDEIGNIVTFSRDNIDDIQAALSSADSNAQLGHIIGDYRYQFMTDDEVAIYNYYLGKGDKEQADAYLSSLEDTLNQRYGGKLAESAQELNIEWLMAINVGLDQYVSGVRNLDNFFTGSEADPTSPFQYAGGIIREGIESDFWRGAWDLGVTMSNQLPSILVGSVTGSVGGLVTMGASVAGNSYAEMRNLGYNENQARGYSALVTAAELGLQYVLGGYTKLGGKLSNGAAEFFASKVDNAVAKIAIKYGASMLSEGFEESLQSILEPMFKSFVTGDTYDVDWGEVLYSGILGALSAGVLESVPTVVGGIVEANDIKAQGTAFRKNGGDIGNLAAFVKEHGDTMFSADSVAYRLAGKVNDATSAYQIGTLLNEVNATITEQNKADIMKSLTRKGIQPKQAEAYTNALAAVVAGHPLTAEQISALNANEHVAKTLVDVIINPNSTVNQRMQGYNEAIKMTMKGNNATAESAQNGAVASQTGVPSDGSEWSQIDGVDESTGGKTTYEGEDVSIKGISSIKDGVVSVRLEDGREVNARDIDFKREAEGLVYEAVADMNPDTAMELVKGFEAINANKPEADQVPLWSYLRGFKDAYSYGMHGIPFAELATGKVATELTDPIKKIAYNRGKTDSFAKVDSDQARIDKQKATVSKTEKVGKQEKTVKEYKGETHISKIKTKGLTDRQKTSVETLKVVADNLGLNIYFFESPVVNGKRVGKNGYYDPSDRSIHIDLFAGQSGEQTILFTAAHELTHLIHDLSPKKFKVFADFLFENYGKKGISVETLIIDQIKKGKDNNRWEGLSEEEIYDRAYQEVVADACETMLTDSNAIEKIAELKQKDKGLWKKIKDFIEKLVAKIKEVYAGLAPHSKEAQYVRGMVDVAEQLQALWVDALIDAGETYQTIGSRDLSDFSEAKNADGEQLFQYRAMESDKEIYRAMLLKHGLMTEAEIDNLFTTIDKALDVIKDNLEALDYAWDVDIDDRAFLPVKKNSDKLYKVSLDFSTLCRKRLLQQTIQATLQEALNKPLSKEEGIAIRDELMKIQEEGRQIEIACALCYVESARMKSPAQIKKFLKDRESIIKDFFAGKAGGSTKAKIIEAEASTRAKLYKENPEWSVDGKNGVKLDFRNASLKAMPQNSADMIRLAKKGARLSYKPTAEQQKLIDIAKGMNTSDFTSPEGLANLAKNYPELFDAYTSFVRNATHSKGIEKDTWWRAGDSDALIGQTLIDNMNAENGLRSQSWSDFQVIHLLDYIAATIELSTKNAKRQSYTKVPDYVILLGRTGDMINMSLIPTQKYLGELKYDSVEGMDYDTAVKLREKYHATAGTICIGIDNAQIVQLLADITIDYVIPYHQSGMSAATRKLMHIPTWKNYEPYQSESNLSATEAKKNAEKYGVKLLSKSNSNYQKSPKFSEWFDIAEARQIAKMENANPPDPAMQEKLGVMYGAYKAMQNAANNYLKLCAERGLSPKFSHPEADFTAEENYWKLLIDRKMVDNVTGEIIEQQAIKPIFDEADVLGILNRELERYPQVKKDQEYATRKVVEKFLSGDMKMDKDTRQALQKPVDNVTAVNILASADGLQYSDRDLAPTFYSQMGKVVEGMKQDKFGANSVIPMLRGRGVKAEEIRWSGIATWLEGKKSVTKQELLEFIRGSQLQIGEQMSNTATFVDEDGNTYTDNEFKEKAYAMAEEQGIDRDRVKFVLDPDDGTYVAYAGSRFNGIILEAEADDEGMTRWSEYKLNGGTNYREIVFTMPNSSYSNGAMRGHWGQDAEGVLAHARIQDFVVNGKKMLFIEEIQSDWHNEGHQSGYSTQEYEDAVESQDKLYNEYKKMDLAFHKYVRSNEFMTDPEDVRTKKHAWLREKAETAQKKYLDAEKVVNSLKEKGAGDTPDAPFKDTYHEYVLKRLLRMAAEEGYDCIGWTPAYMQEERWSEDYAEGYRIEYDQDMPKFLKKYGRQWGATVGKTSLYGEYTLADFERDFRSEVEDIWADPDDKEFYFFYADNGKYTARAVNKKTYEVLERTFRERKGANEVWSMGITDSMKDSVLHEGQVLYSLREVDPVEPTSDKWARTLTTAEVKAKFPNLWDVAADESEVRNPTQISGTVRSYRKVYDFLKAEGFDGTILDASSGLGYGTRAGIEEYGFKVDDIEPYPDKSYKPKYKDYSKLHKKYDVIISNAVLNVIPQDQRDALVVKMGELLKDGGRMFINVRGDDVRNASSKVAINDDLMEYYISQSGSYQKGFTKTELVAYLQDALGEGFDVKPISWFGKTSAVVTKAENIKYSDRDGEGLTAKDRFYISFLEALNNETDATTSRDSSAKEVSTQTEAKPKTWQDEAEAYYTEIYDQLSEDIKKRMPSFEDVLSYDWEKVGFGTRTPVSDIIWLTREESNRDKRKRLEQAAFMLGDLMKHHKVIVDFTKFSDRDTDSLSNRSLLANALESTAQSEIEKNKLKQYKEKIDLINSEEQKLHELREQIKEISFSRGRRDVEKLRSLQFEANQTASRINTYDRQLLTLEASKPLKAVLEREKQLAYKKAEKKGKEALSAYREKAAQTQRELMTRYQESRRKATEGRHMTDYRHKIKDVVSKLNQLLLRPTKDKHIKEELRVAVAEALSVINMDTVGADERIAKYDALIAKTNDPDMAMELAKTRDRIMLQGEALKDKLTALQTAYEKIKNSADPELKNAYQETVMNTIKNVVQFVGNTSLRDMNLSQLEAVYEMYSMILHVVRTANKAFKQKQGETIMQLAESVNEEVRQVSKEKFARNPLITTLRKIGWTLLKPFTAFRTIGSDTLTGLYKELRNGEDVYYVDINEAKAFIQAQYKKHNYESWDKDVTKTFKSNTGDEFILNLEQMMSLYAYSHRQQAIAHMMEGGLVLKGNVIVKKNKLGIPISQEVNTAAAFNISEETLQEICDSLTKEQKAFVDDMQAYLSDVMGAKGNEVSMELLGIKLFKEKYYFPLKSSKYYMGFNAEEAGEIKLKNSSFSKETVHHANNPVVLENFTDVWAGHVNDMSMYHAFVLALEDFTRVYNYKTRSAENLKTMDTKATLNTAYGDGATQYIENFLKSLNGGVRSESVGIADKAVSLSKKGAVLASASVVIQQPSAIMRAMALINPIHFATSTHKSINLLKHNRDWAEIKQYAPIAGIKEMGRFDVGMGQSTVKWIKDQNTFMENVDEALGKAPAFMDEITWVAIWNAVKNEVKHQHKNLAVGSEAYLKKCGERFTEVVSLTQVYDSVFSRSDIMRNQSWIAKALTSFMAEPSTTLNMVVDSFVQGKRTGKVGGFIKTTAGTGGAIVASVVFNAALKSIITAMRDDDEDESYAEKYLGAFVGNAMDDLNPLSYIPFVKDIVSIFNGYDVERMDMALFSDLKNAIDAFDSDSKSEYEKWSGLVGAVSAFFGVPIKNVERDIRGAYNTIKSFSEGEKTTSAGILNSIREALTGEEISNTQQLYEAYLNDDKEQIKRVEGRFDDKSEIESALKKALRDNDSRIRDAAKARMDGDITEYTRIAREIIAEGHFSQDTVVGAINAEINAIKREQAEGTTEDTTGVEEDEVTSIYKASDANTAFDNGDTALAKEIIQDLIDTKVSNGMEEKNAKSSLRSSMTSYWKPLYKEAYANGDTSEMYRIRVILLDSGLYGGGNDVVKTVQNWLKD